MTTNDAPPRGRQLSDIGPLAQLRAGRLGVRLPLLLVGLFLYGASMAMVLRGTLGQIPWDVLHVGVSHHIPLSFGTIVIGVSLLVLIGWIPLRQKPGLGTIGNAQSRLDRSKQSGCTSAKAWSIMPRCS